MNFSLISPMPELAERIEREGIVQGNEILKIDHFLNHRIEPRFMQRMAREIAARLRQFEPDMILTAEASGIAPGLMVALELDIPMVYGKKYHPDVEVPALSRCIPSPTKGGEVKMVVSQKYLTAGQRVAIVDDFLSNGRTAAALVDITKEADCTPVAAAFLVAKSFKKGHQLMEAAGVPVVTLAQVDALVDGKAILRKA
ncbi:MAG: xanthine phosphoribosyltransferase [Candidatus Dactylopiibacterium carminicum]|uniref:Xanthine phosphoribosyltransferase n=1 Tax=Candidatus Dactylopiibacterium carminicum TaxID=857335 RepID=A0A272EQA0_9RHOO|nr:xanthine phosphoribosyltransferase [Candidatus Dactylopiibacterium carminicum]KAF7598572.1 xanthine phosphoribosyltransferase [Candidatus Dactylopiibacterium carminicum]PAS92294.1 MAG: xanthine phosphoribosyltransferase [Candidatus Dactylopiibacterium carminicum]PAS92700.1 MAG: xanthine phosphoribosyltransferase [Candidatus Dactylopiibacterium carminicum]PAS98233.1 MAG: xanthine phosphoribosyltransferase [Candidatus Dactylopiibacterium carminicum]